MRVSVIVPVRDDPRIDGLLASLAAQRQAPDFEVLVALDGSRRAPRETPGGPPVRLLDLPARGPYAARNAAAREARGDVLLFTDTDCVCPADWVAHAAGRFGGPASVPVAVALQGTSSALESSRVSLWIQDEYERYVASHAATSHRRMCNTRCFGIRREAFAAQPFPEAHLRGGDGAYGLALERRGVPVHWDPAWRVLHRNPESRVVFARQLFRQGLDGVRWSRTDGADLFGTPADPSRAGVRVHRRAATSRPFAATASAAAVCASAVFGLATVALPYSAGRPVFRRFARAAHFAGRLRGEAEKR